MAQDGPPSRGARREWGGHGRSEGRPGGRTLVPRVSPARRSTVAVGGWGGPGEASHARCGGPAPEVQFWGRGGTGPERRVWPPEMGDAFAFCCEDAWRPACPASRMTGGIVCSNAGGVGGSSWSVGSSLGTRPRRSGVPG